MKLKSLSFSVMVGLAFGLSAQATMASGYHFGTQSVSSQATANASAAEAADASTIFYNAAGMTKLEGTNISGAVNLVLPDVEYSNGKGSYPGNGPIAGQTSGKISDDVVAVPHVYLTHKLNDRVAIGLGVYVPFASETEYQRDSVLRYNVNQTGLKTIDINPTIAFKVNDQHSLAVGLIAQYAEASLRQYANFGAFTVTGGAAPAGNGNADGYAEVEGNDWGYGYNLAWMWDVTDRTRIGLNYRSKVEHTLKGEAKWSVPAGVPVSSGGPVGASLRAVGYAANESAKVDIETPESLSLHGMHKLDPKWTLFGDLTWTKHSRFDTVDVVYGNTKYPSNTNYTRLNPAWKDTFKLALGASYQYSTPLQLRFGVAYDQSPVPDDDHRLSTIPDNDRYWFSVGGKYDLSKNSSVNLAYSYIYIKDAKANVNGYCGKAAPTCPPSCVTSNTSGSAEYNSHAQIVGVQYNYRF